MSAGQRLRWFRRLALAGAALAAVVIVLGAWVRLTDAGLGCPDWPGCYGHLYPQSGHQLGRAWHEMIHRYAATLLGCIIVALCVWAVVERQKPQQPLLPVVLLLAVVCLQGTLGALTVTLLLKPLIVTAHLLGGLTTLGLLWWLSITPQKEDADSADLRLRPFAVLAFVILSVQIFLGGWTSTNYAAVSCPDFPTCQRSWWPSMDFRDAFILWRGVGIDYEGGILANTARIAIHITHRMGAVVAGCTVIALGVSSAIGARRPRVRRAGWLVTLAVILQISIGISTVRFGVPLWLATMHNAGAVLMVVSMLWLLRALWPAPSAGMVPLHRVDHP